MSSLSYCYSLNSNNTHVPKTRRSMRRILNMDLKWLEHPWILLLALVTIWEASLCSSFWETGEFVVLLGNQQQQQCVHNQSGHGLFSKSNSNNTCPAINHTSTFSSFSRYFPTETLGPHFVGFLFCTLCIIEAIRQAYKARQTAMEMAALDQLEKKLAKVLSVTKRMSVEKLHQWRGSLSNNAHISDQQEDQWEQSIEATLHNAFRVWTPVLTTLLAWYILLPWPVLWLAHRNSSNENYCQVDPSWVTFGIDHGSRRAFDALTQMQESLVALAWKIALPFHVWQPIPLIRRLRVLARWARYVRFAGPMLRLLLKLHDQFWVFSKTWRQTYAVHLHRAQRLAHKSMMFADIRRIESLAKVQTTLASLPSQLLRNSSAARLLAIKREQGERLRRRLAWLKMKLMHTSHRNFSSVEIYERLNDLAQEVTSQVRSAFWNAHLISPQTRFSVGWRIIVTCTLLSELNRLYWSWKFSGTFDMRYTDMTRQVLGLCQTSSRPVRRWIGKLLKLPYNHPWLDTCRQSSPSSQLSLQVARWSEIGIDLVGFLDIYVWFYTGELDETGVVVPKSFFSRCILPGTLTQVLDHPTVPQALPMLIHRVWIAMGSVGYGRVIRWCLALWPAMELHFVGPIHRYLFRPMDEREFMKYSESLGLMRTFSSSMASYPVLSSSMVFPPAPQPFGNVPSQSDLFDTSMQSVLEESEGYGLFY